MIRQTMLAALVGMALLATSARAQDNLGTSTSESPTASPPLSPQPVDSGPAANVPTLESAPQPSLASGPNLTKPGSGGYGGASGGGLGMFFNPVVGQLPYAGGYSALEFFNASVPGQNTSLGYVQQRANAVAPIWQDHANEFFMDANLNNEAFDTQAVLPDSHLRFPSDLWNVNMGTGYRHLFDNGWTAGGTVAVGSASDDPFHSIHEMTINVSGFTRIPSFDDNAWLFGFSLSSNSQVLPFVPIPFVAYLYAPSPKLQAMIGFPFANVVYRPVDNVTLDVSYALLTNFHARAAYRLGKKWNIYTGLDFDNENWFLADRANEDERFFYYDDRLSSGIQYIFSHNCLMELSSGYVFDRYYFQGTSFTDQGYDHLKIDPGAFVALRFQARF
jgi:hypothetical protein